MKKLREWLRVQWQKMFGVEIVNCSTCPYWRFHSSEEPRPRFQGVMENGVFRLARLPGQDTADRLGVCMKAPIVFVPMERMGLGVRVTHSDYCCALHPNYVPDYRMPSGAQFLPGVGEHAGFDKPPTFSDALGAAQLRPELYPDGLKEPLKGMIAPVSGDAANDPANKT